LNLNLNVNVNLPDSPRLSFRISIFEFRILALVLLLLCGCQNVPKYKKDSGKFPEWAGYEGKNFYPSNGTVAAIDTTANTVTIIHGGGSKVYAVAPNTRIIHEGTDVPLAQLPVNQTIKYGLSPDGKQFRSIWFGQRLYQYHPPVPAKKPASG